VKYGWARNVHRARERRPSGCAAERDDWSDTSLSHERLTALARVRRRVQFFLLLPLVAFPSLAAAQIPSDPRAVEFEPSADHARIVRGVPMIERYELRFYAVGSEAILQSIDMGKPTPDADGMIRYSFAGALTGWAVQNVPYEARVIAMGPYGTSADGVTSSSFLFPNGRPSATPPGPACTFTLTPASHVVSTAASVGSFIVGAADGCAWSAISSAAWLIVTGGDRGLGTGIVNFSIGPNADPSERLATITVGPSTFSVSQTGGCTITLTPTSQGFNPPGGSGSVAVSAPPGCSWTAVRAGSWISITSGASGSANGTVRYTVAANTGSTTRVGTLTIAGRPVTVTQSAGTAPNAPAGTRVVIIR
jgi:hypothetical protein